MASGMGWLGGAPTRGDRPGDCRRAAWAAINIAAKSKVNNEPLLVGYPRFGKTNFQTAVGSSKVESHLPRYQECPTISTLSQPAKSSGKMRG